MANPHKGEVSATIDGTEYVFRIATNEWCELEAEHGKTTDELITEFYAMAAASKLDMSRVRSFFRAALSGSMPDIDHKEAGAIMSDMGLVDAAGLLGRVISASLPDDEEGEKKPRPPKAAKA